MPITQAQRDQRRHYIGSSDMAAILGVSPWATAHDVWLEKTGKLQEREPTEAMMAGTFLEEGILLYAESQLGKIQRNQFRTYPEAHLGAHIDALAMDRGEEPIEAKKVELTNPSFEAWGDPGTDQVPDEVIVQCHVHMICQGKTRPVERCHVAGLIAGRLSMYEVPYSPELVETICETAACFWEHRVQADSPPTNTLPSVETLRRVRRQPGKMAPVDPGLVRTYLAAQAAVKEAEAAEETARAVLLTALGDAEGGDAGEAGIVSYLTQTRKTLDTKRLTAERPEIAAEFMKSTSFPVLRIGKPQSAKKGSK